MRSSLAWVLAVLHLCGAAVADDVTPSIVEVETTYQRPDWMIPWQMEAVSAVYGSGCILEGKRILTNAHVVSDETLVRVRRAGTADRFFAKVEAVSHELDLALLRVEDDAFFAGTHPLPIGELPRIGDEVRAYGFPVGGTRVTITRGVVSRIERQSYSHSGYDNLVCQTDAAINEGASGGPVLDDGNRIVGVAFQGSSEGENIGYMVPAPVVKHFLHDLEDGKLDGSPLLPVSWQDLENRSLRSFLGLASGHSGVWIRRVWPGAKDFRPGDVLLAIDGCDIGNDGTIEIRPGDRVSAVYAADRKQLGEHIPVSVLRDGKLAELDLALDIAKQRYPYVVPRYAYETRPTYYVIGGLAFSPLTTGYVSAWRDFDRMPFRLRKYWYEERTEANAWRREVVACIKVLPDRLNSGYESAEDHVVARVNGKRIGSMRDLIAAFEENKGDYHRILFETDGYEVVLPRTETTKRSPEILARYDVHADRSADLRKEREEAKPDGKR